VIGAARAAALLLMGAALFACGPASPDRDLLRRSWDGYRHAFVTPDGRVVRPEHGGDTVSEGQAYTLLRAVWMDDRATFDRVWRWTRTHLARTGREGASLLAWHWTPAAGGRVDDWNVATDADTDVALALLMAAERWPPRDADLPPYRASALAIIADLAAHALVEDTRGMPVLLPGAWADQRSQDRAVVINPSYLSPATYRVFHRVTADGRWLALASSAYDVLGAVCTKDAVIPDWVRWRSADDWAVEGTGRVRSGWDAVRVPWRVATDWLWFGEPRARAFLDGCLVPFVQRRTRAGHGLAVEYSLTGEVLGADDHPLANALYAFALSDPDERNALLARVEARMVRGSGGLFFGQLDRYYVNSLAYLPFLARAGRYSPPASPGREPPVLD
jgi:endo-1,4-beta-D-glucanase Y